MKTIYFAKVVRPLAIIMLLLITPQIGNAFTITLDSMMREVRAAARLGSQNESGYRWSEAPGLFNVNFDFDPKNQYVIGVAFASASQDSSIAINSNRLDISGSFGASAGSFSTPGSASASASSKLRVNFFVDGPAEYAFTFEDNMASSAAYLMMWNTDMPSTDMKRWVLFGAELPWSGILQKPGHYQFDFWVSTEDDSSADCNMSFFVAGAPVPEPSTILLFGAGLIGLAGYGRKRSLQ